MTSMMTQTDMCVCRDCTDTSDENYVKKDEWNTVTITIAVTITITVYLNFYPEALQSVILYCTESTETVHRYYRTETFQHFRGIPTLILLFVEILKCVL